MDTLDIDILKWMTKREQYFELKDIIDKSLCVKESWLLIKDFGEYFKDHPNEQEITSDFKMWQRVVRHPGWKPEEASTYSRIVDNILNATNPNRASFMESINHLKATVEYKELYDDLAAGRATVADAESRTRQILKDKVVDQKSKVTMDLNALSTQSRTGGYFFRCEDLNRSIGPLRRGDFAVVAKRPEVGGTSFLVSELSFMLEQTDGNAIIFNNEEEPSKVYTRMVSSALNVDYRTLLGDPAKYQGEYNKWLGKSEWDLIHDTNMTVASIHQQLEEKPYDLIAINVLLKVGGTGKQEDHDKFQELGEECRRIAQRYGPVIAVVQADPTAEGMAYIPQDRIYKSKTALQGEADVLIMIGTDEQIVDHRRYIHVAKNKIPPAPCTFTKEKHIKCECHFDIDTGRFTSVNHKHNSRTTK